MSKSLGKITRQRPRGRGGAFPLVAASGSSAGSRTSGRHVSGIGALDAAEKLHPALRRKVTPVRSKRARGLIAHRAMVAREDILRIPPQCSRLDRDDRAPASNPARKLAGVVVRNAHAEKGALEGSAGVGVVVIGISAEMTFPGSEIGAGFSGDGVFAGPFRLGLTAENVLQLVPPVGAFRLADFMEASG